MNISTEFQLALKYYQSGNLAQAALICETLLQKKPGELPLLHFLGIVYQQLQNYDAAIKYLRLALELDCTSFEGFYNLGSALEKKGTLKEAIDCYQKVIQLNPNFADAHIKLGRALQSEGQIDDAISCYQKIIKINPNDAGIYFNLGVVLQDKGQLDEAISCYQKALALNLNIAGIHNNLGLAFQNKGRIDKAINCYQNAIKLDPDFADAYNNLGISLQEKRQLNEAISCYRKAIQINPNFADAHWNLSLALLLSGNFEEGWREYEWRWKVDKLIVTSRKFSQTLFNLENIFERTILLHAEQGFGDNIQFIRYAPLLARSGAKVIVECHKELYSLFENIEGVHQVIGFNEQPPPSDLNCPILSLPRIFRTTLETIPANVPYLTVSSLKTRRWKERFMRDQSKLRVGLVWHGNPNDKNNMNRSMPFAHFSPLAKFTDIAFYSLQKGNASEQAKNLPMGMTFIDLTEEINDFSDTAALIENIDLTISVDTSVVHLAGALGKPIWTLLPFAPDWRWMLNREDSPWYPTMRLFRQPSPGDWESVIAAVKDELLRFQPQH